MNIVFDIQTNGQSNSVLIDEFVKNAETVGLVGLAGHR
jgi:hypothetical protein